MRVRNLSCVVFSVFSLTFVLSAASSSYAQLLFSENFNDANAASRWTAHAGVAPLSDPNAFPFLDTSFDTFPIPVPDGVNDNFDDFSFDYSVHGVPVAPNTTDSSTIGMRLRANLFTGQFGGFSVSPNGQNFTGDYSITFDLWSSSVGPFPGGGSSSTMLSTYGLLTAGTASQVPGSGTTDGVYFSNTGDAGSGADYRIYSGARNSSHQLFDPDPNTGTGDVIDGQATYIGGTRNATAQVYYDATGDPNREGRTVPSSVQLAVETLYGDPNGDPNGFIMAGPLGGFDPNGDPQAAAGFQWNEMEIRKVGNQIDLFMNGINTLSFDTSDWFDPNTPATDPNTNGTYTPGGGNISFGHADINFGGPSTAVAQDLVYTLIDNVEVNAIVAEDPDFDDSGDVGGTDFLIWQRNQPITDGTATNGDGDANDDGDVTAADLAIWETYFGGPPPVSAAVAAVPEPSTFVSWIMFSLFSLLGYRPCRTVASTH